MAGVRGFIAESAIDWYIIHFNNLGFFSITEQATKENIHVQGY